MTSTYLQLAGASIKDSASISGLTSEYRWDPSAKMSYLMLTDATQKSIDALVTSGWTVVTSTDFNTKGKQPPWQ